MVKYKVQLNARAYRDLEEIFNYISNELQAPENAKRQTERLWEALKKIGYVPTITSGAKDWKIRRQRLSTIINR